MKEVRKVLYEHTPHRHTPQNVNSLHRVEQARGNFNQRVAIGMTHFFQNMGVFWFILAWIVLWMAVNVTVVRFDPLPFPLLLALASIPQLPLMVVIMIGQGVLGHHAELQADEAFQTTQHSFHDVEQLMKHLDAQDTELLKQTRLLEQSSELLLKHTDFLARLATFLREPSTAPIEADLDTEEGKGAI